MTAHVYSPSRRERKRAMRCRAWLNGEEVTNRCYYADTKRGVVRLYKEDSQGRKYVDPETGEAAEEERRGHVVIRRRSA